MQTIPFRIIVASLALAALVGSGVQLMKLRAQETPPAPAPTPVPPVASYLAPDYHVVLQGKAPLRVLLSEKQPMLAWKGEAEVRTTRVTDGVPLYTAKAEEQVGLVRMDDQSCWLRQDGKNFCAIPTALRLESDKPIHIWTAKPDAWTTFTGTLIITPTAANTFSLAREMLLEDYLRNVVPAEMPASFHPQALRAQAIIARTYALMEMGRFADEGADVCSDQRSQMFLPDAKRTAVADNAVTETRGLVLYYGDQLAEPYYHADCGGVTDDAGLLWGPERARPYLAGIVDAPAGKLPPEPMIQGLLSAKDPYCTGANAQHWTRSFTAAEVDALVSQNLPAVTGDATDQLSKVTALSIEERTPHGRVAHLRVTGADANGNEASFVVNGDAVRWLFGHGKPGADGLWSTLFELTVNKDAAGQITGYTFTGAGRGHGIGLCQWGANGRAKAGQTFREIIHAYYPGTQLSDEKAPHSTPPGTPPSDEKEPPLRPEE